MQPPKRFHDGQGIGGLAFLHFRFAVWALSLRVYIYREMYPALLNKSSTFHREGWWIRMRAIVTRNESECEKSQTGPTKASDEQITCHKSLWGSYPTCYIAMARITQSIAHLSRLHVWEILFTGPASAKFAGFHPASYLEGCLRIRLSITVII